MSNSNQSRTWAPTPAYSLFLRWLLLAGLMAFGFWMAWDMGFLQRLLVADRSRIGLLISVIFVIGSLHCATRSLYLSRQQEALETIIRLTAQQRPALVNGRAALNKQVLPASLAASYLSGALHRDTGNAPQTPPDQQLFAQVMAEQARGQHETGWFVANALVKLGLLGTVIGFVLMLAPVATLESFDQNRIQGLLQQMTVGMGVALNTTLLGLSGTLLLGMQYLLLDRAADRLVAQTVEFTESCLLSAPDDNDGP